MVAIYAVLVLNVMGGLLDFARVHLESLCQADILEDQGGQVITPERKDGGMANNAAQTLESKKDS